MKCIYCGCMDSKVIDSRVNEDGTSIRRRRECMNCGKRFTTYETIETAPIMVIKKDGRHQPFDIGKVERGIRQCTEKLAISQDEIDRTLRPHRYAVFVQTDDEVLDYQRAVKFYQGSQVTITPGGCHAYENFSADIPAALEFLRSFYKKQA